MHPRPPQVGCGPTVKCGSGLPHPTTHINLLASMCAILHCIRQSQKGTSHETFGHGGGVDSIPFLSNSRGRAEPRIHGVADARLPATAILWLVGKFISATCAAAPRPRFAVHHAASAAGGSTRVLLPEAKARERAHTPNIRESAPSRRRGP